MCAAFWPCYLSRTQPDFDLGWLPNGPTTPGPNPNPQLHAWSHARLVLDTGLKPWPICSSLFGLLGLPLPRPVTAKASPNDWACLCDLKTETQLRLGPLGLPRASVLAQNASSFATGLPITWPVACRHDLDYLVAATRGPHALRALPYSRHRDWAMVFESKCIFFWHSK